MAVIRPRYLPPRQRNEHTLVTCGRRPYRIVADARIVAIGNDERKFAVRQIFETIYTEQHDDDYSVLWEAQLRLARLDMESNALDRAASLLDAAAAAVAQMSVHYGQTMVLRRQGRRALLRVGDAKARRLLETAYDRAVNSMFLEEIAAALIGLSCIDVATDPQQAARRCGAFEGLIKRFPVRVDPVTASFHQRVRSKLNAREAELADAAASRSTWR